MGATIGSNQAVVADAAGSVELLGSLHFQHVLVFEVWWMKSLC